MEGGTNTSATDPVSLGEYIQQGRVLAALSIRKLADRVGTDASNISRIERGEITTPTVTLLKRIADVLDLDFAKMLSYVGVDYELPQPFTLAGYLRQKWSLPDKAIMEAEEAIARIVEKYQRWRR